MRLATSLLTALTILAIANTDAIAQTTFRAPIIVRNASPDDAGVKNRDTLLIGLDPAATEGLDTTLGEKRLPPFPPDQIFEARLTDRTGRPVFGNGSRTDLRPAIASSQIDTFLIRFQPGAGGTPITITWPENLAQYAGRMTIRTSSGSADMLTETQLVITDPDVSRATIIREGDAIGAARSENGAGFFELEPVRNPIRRGERLTIAYVLSRPAAIEMRLVDMVGQSSITHSEGQVAAGLSSLTLDLSRFATGSYLFAISSDGVTVSRRLLIVE